jgi:hypothetical protein
MKKLFILIISMVFIGLFSVHAQGKSKRPEVPAVTKSVLEAKYPKSEKVNWRVEKPGEFGAEFTLNGVESSSVFDSNFFTI